MIERNKKRAENLMNQVSQEAKHGGVVTEESQSIFENVELVKYLFAVLILILVLIISVIALCIARICLKEKTEEQIRRIHKSLKDEHGTVQTQSGMVKAEDTSRNTEPLEEITQY
jgi:flagellar biosynthesis/type III secretory pathway M-ring protein FliF/YscJ